MYLHIAMSDDLRLYAAEVAAAVKAQIDLGDLERTAQGDTGNDQLTERLEPFFQEVRQQLSALLSA